MEEIKEFLIKNGFKVDSIKHNIFYNNNCTVIIDGFHYEIQWKDKAFIDIVEMVLMDLNIYWLVGVLTWYDLIDKDYKK